MKLAVGGVTVALPAPEDGSSILQSVYLSGLVEPISMCAGLGACGKCRLRFLPESTHIPPALPEDIQVLGVTLTEQGWRLSCRHKAEAGAVLALPEHARLTCPLTTVKQKVAFTAAPMAVDFGSTSLHFASVDSKNAVSAGRTHVRINPQMGAGADIISRMAYALRGNGLARLAKLSREALLRMVFVIEQEEGGSVSEICIAANPAMTMLLLGKDISGLAAAPYRLDYRGGRQEHVPGLPPLWVSPFISPFIGGDLSAGYAFLTLRQGEPIEYPFILADMGTNGEFILALSPDKALAASIPLGPAIEGMGMSCGAEARPGVITSFELSPVGLVPHILPGVIDLETPLGISATGFISMTAQLLKSGLIKPDGLFAPSPPDSASLLARRLNQHLRRLERGTMWSLDMHSSLGLTASDLEALLKVKAAFSLVLKLLLQKANLCFSDVKTMYLAGALGTHINVGDLQTLGFIPAGGGMRVKDIGNSSLSGAVLLAARPELREPLTQWCGLVETLDIAEHKDFNHLYAREMRFEWI